MAERSIVVRMLTYNIRHGQGMDDSVDLRRISRVIREASPDIAALQELDNATARSGGIEQLAALGALTGMQTVFGGSMPYAGGEYGVGLLSRHPILSAMNHPLPHSAEREPRTALTGTIGLTATGADLGVICTHFDHLEDPRDRTVQAEALRGIMSGAGQCPWILAGDLNATPDSEVVRSLATDWSDTSAGVWKPTFPNGTPNETIDYILVRPEPRWRVVSTDVIDERVASDHRPVLAILELLP